MKTAIKTFSLACIALITMISCSKDDDPADNDFFIGKYSGTVSFTSTKSGDTNVGSTSGSVTVTKIGDNYSFNFSDNIPTIADITMEKGDNNTIIFSDNGIGSITVTATTLKIAYAKDGRAWIADCTR